MTVEELKKLIAQMQEEKKAEEAAKAAAPAPAPAPAPEQTVSARELREIIRAELDHKEHPEEDQPLTEDAAREILRAELEAYFAPKPEPEEEPVVEEEEVVEEEPVEEENDLLSGDDIRQIIREELAAAKAEEAVVEEKEEEPAPVEEEKVEEEPVEEEKPAGLTAEEVREIIKEELAGQPEPEKDPLPEENKKEIDEIKEKMLTAEQIREIFKEELEKIAVVPAPEPEPEPAPEPAPEPEPVVVEEPVAEPEPAPEPVPVERKPRVHFIDRMKEADEVVINNYNEIKSYALAYGLKSRISNFADTFRLHNKAYLKITALGKNLKIYFALDPADYAESTIPFKDVSKKKAYEDTPFCFKVQSKLSLKRAKALIDDVCIPDGYEKEVGEDGEVEVKNYASQLRFIKTEDLENDEGDGEDEEE